MMTEDEMYTTGKRYDVSYPGLTDLHIHIQRNKTYVQWIDADGLTNNFRMLNYPQLPENGIEVEFVWQIRRPSGELLQSGDYNYLERQEKLYTMEMARIPRLEDGLKAAINGLFRRRVEFGGSEAQTGPSVFLLDGSIMTPIVFEVNVIDEVEGDDGKIEVNVQQGDAPYEYSLDRVSWQNEPLFENLGPGAYSVLVRAKDLVALGAPPRYTNVRIRIKALTESENAI